MNNNLFASDLLSSFYKEIADKEYAILGNFNGLPNEYIAKNVDILVNEKNLEQIIEKLISCASSLSYQLIWKNKLEYSYGFVFAKISGDGIYSVKFNLLYGLKWRGIEYLDINQILSNNKICNNLKVLKKTDQVMVLILKNLLYDKKIKEKYFKEIKQVDRNKLEKLIKGSLSQNLSKKISHKIEIDKIQEIKNLRRKIVFSLITKNLISLKFYKNFIDHLLAKCSFKSNFGSFIVFSGADGAGKSTLIEDLVNLFFYLGITKNKIPHHFLTKNTPSIHKLFFIPKKYSKQDYTKPYKAKPAGKISSIVRFLYYFIAFKIDYYLFIKRELKENYIVLFDRYLSDLAVDSLRMRISLNKSLVQKLSINSIYSDHIFFITADSNKILSRKDELDFNQLEYLNLNYYRLSDKIYKSEVFENNHEIQLSKNKLYKKVFNFLESHYSKQ